MSELEIEEFLKKVEDGIAEAQHNMLVEKALHDSSLVVTDGHGGIKEVSAKELLAAQ